MAISLVISAGAYEDWLEPGGETGTAPAEAVQAPVAPVTEAAPRPAAPKDVIPVVAEEPPPPRRVYQPAAAAPVEPAPAPVTYYEPEPSAAPIKTAAAKPLMTWEGTSSYSADEVLATASEAWTAVSDFLDGHLDLGVRMTKNELEDNTRPIEDSFLGNITELEGDEDYSMRFFVDVMFIKYLGMEWTTDELTADTINYNNGQSDGSVEISGPIWSIVGRYPNPTRFTPYAGIGKAYMDASFTNDKWWNLGYPSEAMWINLGRPSTGYRSVRRNITVSGEDVNVMFFGCAIRITDWLSADIYYRTMDITLDAHYERTGAYSFDDVQTEDGEFTLDHTTMGFGLKYVF